MKTKTLIAHFHGNALKPCGRTDCHTMQVRQYLSPRPDQVGSSIQEAVHMLLDENSEPGDAPHVGAQGAERSL